MPPFRTLAIFLFLSLPQAASAKCLDTSDGACRYPKGDAWCVEHHKPPYAYADKCPQATRAPQADTGRTSADSSNQIASSVRDAQYGASDLARVEQQSKERIEMEALRLAEEEAHRLVEEDKQRENEKRRKRPTDRLSTEAHRRDASPNNLEEAVELFHAKDGSDLASAPKIRPDGGMYYMTGVIQKADSKDPEFLATIFAPTGRDLQTLMMGAIMGNPSPRIPSSKLYFTVIIPESLQVYYFEKAKIQGVFDLVGRYASNNSYYTVAGQEMSVPVFEAVYFVMQGQGTTAPRAPKSSAEPSQEGIAREVDRYIPVIKDKVRQFWIRPPALAGEFVTVVSLRLAQGGEVVPNSVGVVQSSGNAAFDHSVIAAVYNASPIPVPSGPAFDRFREFNLKFTP